MPDEQDRAEALDDDKGAFPVETDPGVDLLDQTADADPDVAEVAGGVIELDEEGNQLMGVEPDPDRADDPYHEDEPAPEVAAMHVVDEP